jgi:hypothetical protein
LSISDVVEIRVWFDPQIWAVGVSADQPETEMIWIYVCAERRRYYSPTPTDDNVVTVTPCVI